MRRLSHPSHLIRFVLATASLSLALSACHMKPAAYDQPFTAASDIQLLSAEGVLPRNINLKAFEPHRKEFACALAEARTPKPAANQAQQAQSLFEQGMALTSPALWPNERKHPQAVQLWQQAAELGHWKAAMMLVQTYRTGAGQNSEKGQFYVPAQASEQVIERLETLMKQNVPDAFYEMGHAYQSGYGVPPDASRAWALWELAADMGSARAQTHIAKALKYGEGADALKGGGAWANMKVAIQMLECAVAQGDGEAALLLGRLLDLYAQAGQALNGDKEAQFERARQILHNGVKWGSEDAASYLFSAFHQGNPLANNAVDKTRAERYSALGDALFNNPDLRFPNLDRVLPLPPAKLPHWNMADVDGLIKAAQAVRVTPTQPQQPAANAPGRARVPEGHSLVMPADRSQWAQTPIVAYRDILSEPGQRTGLSAAAHEGYYQPLHIWATHPQSQPAGGMSAGSWDALRMRALAEVPPLHFAAGESLSLLGDAYGTRLSSLFQEEGDHRLVHWRYVGTARAVLPLADHLARAGLVQAIAKATDTRCAEGQACPQSGIWQPEVGNTEHPLAQVFNGTLAGESWRRQAFVQEGQAMPSFSQQLAPALAEGKAAKLKVQWRLMVACEAACGAGFEKAQG